MGAMLFLPSLSCRSTDPERAFRRFGLDPACCLLCLGTEEAPVHGGGGEGYAVHASDEILVTVDSGDFDGMSRRDSSKSCSNRNPRKSTEPRTSRFLQELTVPVRACSVQSLGSG